MKFGCGNGVHEIAEQIQIVRTDSGDQCGAIVIDSTARGPAMGGCRVWHYADDSALMKDATRLARGMSYKNALAGLPFGGGKAVLKAPVGNADRNAVFRAFAEAINALEGAYITAEDVGTSVADMEFVHEYTPYVAGLRSYDGRAGGDPSPWTALGVFESMRAAAQLRFNRDLAGLTVAVQGVGNVGLRLCELLKQAGAKFVVADHFEDKARAAVASLDAEIVTADEILFAEVNILAPCALGGILNEETIHRLKADVIVGAANNQLATPEDGYRLLEAGILYAPDYVVNAGGIINVAAERLGEAQSQVEARIMQIPQRLREILEIAESEKRPTNFIADELARRTVASRTAQRARSV